MTGKYEIHIYKLDYVIPDWHNLTMVRLLQTCWYQCGENQCSIVQLYSLKSVYHNFADLLFLQFFPL